jgi:tetratricopeptide (TPR) repeat protein
MMLRAAHGLVLALVAASLLPFAGCLKAQIQENRRQLEQQRTELDQLKREVAELNARTTAPPPVVAPPGTCDKTVEHAATKKGGERFAAGEFGTALGYYQDALTACPGSAQAELNIAHTYEALGDSTNAIAHYRIAAKGRGEGGADAAKQARDALTRLHASQ